MIHQTATGIYMMVLNVNCYRIFFKYSEKWPLIPFFFFFVHVLTCVRDNCINCQKNATHFKHLMICSSSFPLEDSVFWQPRLSIQPTITVLFNPLLIRLAPVRTNDRCQKSPG